MRGRGEWREVHGPSCPMTPAPVGPGCAEALPDSLIRLPRAGDGIEVHDGTRVLPLDVVDGGAPTRSATIEAGMLRPARTGSPLVARGRPRWRAGPVRRLHGTVAVLDLRGRGATFGHWMIDALPNLWLLQRAGFDLDAIDAFLVPATSPWILESLAAAGISAERVMAPPAGGRFDVERLLLPVRDVGSRRVPWWIVRGLTLDGRVTAEADPALPERIYVRRAGAGRRGVADEGRIARLLADLGVTAVDPGEGPLGLQRRRFASARLIVAAHGAALSALAWCRPGATLIELIPTARPNALFIHLAHQAGVRHVALLCPPALDGGDSHGDLRVDLDQLRGAVTAVGGGGRPWT